MDKNKRLYYIDLLKVIAVFLIINSHCEPVYRIKQLATGGALGNSLFFICSGFCLKEVIENKVSWLVNKILKLYIPTVIITILFYTNTDMFWQINIYGRPAFGLSVQLCCFIFCIYY